MTWLLDMTCSGAQIPTVQLVQWKSNFHTHIHKITEPLKQPNKGVHKPPSYPLKPHLCTVPHLQVHFCTLFWVFFNRNTGEKIIENKTSHSTHSKFCSHVSQTYKGANNNCTREEENKVFILLLFVLLSICDQNYVLQGKGNKIPIIRTSFVVNWR